MIRSNRRLAIAGFGALVLVAGVLALSPASASIDTQAQTARDNLANCQLLAAHSASSAQRTRAQQCVTDQTAILVLLGATPTPTVAPTSPTPTAVPTTAPPTTPAPTTAPPTTAPPTTPPPTTGPQLNCAPQPSACGYPDATNTGVPAGTALTVVTGDQTIRTAGTVLDGKDIRGCVKVAAANVTIKRSKITCSNAWVVRSYRDDYTAGGLLLEDVTISCGQSQGTGVASYGFVARRVDVSGCENGFAIDNDVTVEDSYVHDLYIGTAGHTDGAQMAGGAHITMRQNTILNPNDGGTSAIIMNATGESDVLIANNLMAGGAFTLYCPKTSSSNVRVLGNRFSRLYKPKGGEYGPWVYCSQVAQVAGNVWDDTGAPVPA